MGQLEECQVCKRMVRTNDVTLHHYIPQCEGGELEHTIKMCLTCHQTLHFCIPIEEVKFYDNVKKLETHDSFSLYLNWIRKKDHPKQYPARKAARHWLHKTG